jgi:hypothetical protein
LIQFLYDSFSINCITGLSFEKKWLEFLHFHQSKSFELFPDLTVKLFKSDLFRHLFSIITRLKSSEYSQNQLICNSLNKSQRTSFRTLWFTPNAMTSFR